MDNGSPNDPINFFIKLFQCSSTLLLYDKRLSNNSPELLVAASATTKF